jgi:hypothetical protein
MAVPWALPDEVKILEWGSEWVKKPWWKLVEIGDSVVNKKPLPEEKMLTLPLFPVKADGYPVVRMMQKFLSTFLTENGSMHSVILNKDESKVLWSSLERAKDGAYVEIHELPTDQLEKMNEELVPLLKENRMKDAFEWSKRYAEEKYKIELGILKVANIKFFDEFRRVYELSKNGEDLEKHIIETFRAVMNIYKNGWIRFHPRAKALDLLGRPISAGNLDVEPEMLPLGLLSRELGFLLHTQDGWQSIIKIWPGLKIEFYDSDLCDKCYSPDIQKSADKARKKIGAERVIAIDIDRMVHDISPFMDSPSLTPETFIEFNRNILEFIPAYGKFYAVSPKPYAYRKIFKFLTGLDFTRPIVLSPEAPILGLPLFLGMDGVIVNGIVYGKELKRLIEIRMEGVVPKSIRSLEKEKYAEIVRREMENAKRLPLYQACKALKFQLTKDNEVWITQCILMDGEFRKKMIEKMNELRNAGFFKIRKFLRRYLSPEFITYALEEKIAIYPSNPILKMLKDNGILNFKWPL